MSKVRVYEVARELGMKNKELVALFQSLGFSEVRNHMSAVEQDVVERVKRKLERRDEPEVVEERVSRNVVKRRSRGRSRDSGRGAASPPEKRERKAADDPGEEVVKRAKKKDDAAPAADTPPPKKAPEEAPVEAKEPAPAEEKPAAKPEAKEAPAPAKEPEPKAEEPKAKEPEPKAAEPTEAKAPEAEVPKAKEPEAPAKAEAPAAPEAKKTEEPPPAEPKEAAKPTAETKPEPTTESFKASEPPTRKLRQSEAKRVAPPKQTTAQQERRKTSPPKTGIEVWEGRPGVPMPDRPQRRKTFDPRTNKSGGRFGRPGGRRPGYRPSFRNRHQRRGPAEVSTKEMSERKKVVKIEGEVTLGALAHEMSLKATDVLKKLLGMGMTGVHINSTLDSETATLLAEEFGWVVEDVAIDVDEVIEQEMEPEEDVGESIIRPPIVTVMGHVDHGKTTLLDSIRKADVAGGEAGGITQHIGAYRVETKKGTICFLDTPGHAAFTAMRARGAGVTDIVILVVAADDGVMPQTKEAISHAKAAGVPILVAVNKCDRPGVDPERIMREVSAEGLTPEDWGGETIFHQVSALKKEGIDELLESVLLQAELLELTAHPDKRAAGVVVEALLDKGRGSVARVLVQDGTLRRGDVLLCGQAFGKIRAMTDEKGRRLKEAGPATPVEVLGLNEVPEAGDPANGVSDLKLAENLAEERKKARSKREKPHNAGITNLQQLQSMLASEEQLELKVIVKADVQGSVEALRSSLEKQSTKRVKLTIVHTAVGGITETDVQLAVAANAIIIGFNVRPAGKSRKLSEQEEVEIRLYSVIYEAIDDVRAAMEGLLPATKVERELGKAEVRKTFRISKVGTIAGCMVIEGLIKRNGKCRLNRDNIVIWEGALDSLKRYKDDAKEVREGFECGIGLEGYNDIKDGDIIECFEIEEVKAKLGD